MLEPDLPNYMSTHLLRELMKTETSQLVHTMCNCINLHQVQRQTIYIEKPKNLFRKYMPYFASFYLQLETRRVHLI
jgi:hypothetical protein